MKTFYSLFGIVFSILTIQAQTVPTGENISLDQQLTNVNQTSVTSGIIYERVISAANLYNFNKVSTFNTANYSYFKQALSEMHRASNGSKFISLESFKALLVNTTANNTVDLAILNTQFQILNYNEDYPSQGGLTYNTSTNKFVQISGKAPFYSLHNTVIAPAKEYVSGTGITYKIRNDLYFKNGTKIIKTLVANFDDGVNRTLINNQVLTNQNITINYTTSGVKTSTFTITFTDNTTLTTHGKIYFQYQPKKPLKSASTTATNSLISNCFDNNDDFQLQADIAFTGYAANDPTIKAKIDYRIYYADAHTDKKIRKPIIIVDGFDPGDKRKMEDCDCEIIPACAARNTTNGVFDPLKHRSMTDLMEYFNEFDEKKNVLNRLRQEGYDVILVNHPEYTTSNLNGGPDVKIDGGAYYIESNAMALVKLITETKAKLVANGSINDIAIVGPSMGGQISRYALSYMEKNNIPHYTYLWISVDSPHLGANIPLGDQALLYLLKKGGIDAAEDFYDKELSSPASQQQLIEFHRPPQEWVTILGVPTLIDNYHLVNQNYLNAQTVSQGMPSNRGNTYFQQHYNKQNSNGLPNSNGWPQNLRKITVVNGSLTGSKLTQTPNGSPFISFADAIEKVFNFRGFQRVNIDLPWPLGSITFRVHIASLESNYMPASASSEIARFKKLLNDKTTRSPNINNRGVMDNAPGGFFDAQAQLEDEVASEDPVPGVTLPPLINWGTSNDITWENAFKSLSELLGGSEFYRHEYNPIHSFIPTFSSLAHLQPNQNWSNPLDFNLKCPTNNLTPFDSYFGLAKNTQHTSFTKESVDWLLQELAGNPQDPNFPVNSESLTGPEQICNLTTFSFDSCKVPGAVQTWTTSSNLQIVNSNDYSVTVDLASTNANGNGWIKSTFNNGQVMQKDIKVGKPSAVTKLMHVSTFGCTMGEIFAYPAWGADQYEWQVTGAIIVDNGGTSYIGDSSIFVDPIDTNTSFTVKVRGINTCGVSGWYTKTIPMDCSGGPTPLGTDPQANRVDDSVLLYPNPTKGTMNVKLKDLVDNDSNLPTVIYAIKVMDPYYNERKLYEFKTGLKEQTLNVSYLNVGLHYIIVYTDNGTFVKKLLIH